jgi:phage gp46-like protein
MTLPVNTKSYDYNYNKTLNEDVKLKSDEYGFFDLDMRNGDYINVTGLDSLLNACIIAIMTRYGELTDNPTYNEFGCMAHELPKQNQNRLFLFKLETYITDTLTSMRRVNTVNSVDIKRTGIHDYQVEFDITSINDETIKGSVIL